MVVWFGEWREDGGNTYHEGSRTPAYTDLELVVLSCFLAFVLCAVLMGVLGTRGRDKGVTLLKILYTSHSGAIMFVSLFSQAWLQAHVSTGSLHHVTGRPSAQLDSSRVSVAVGLLSFNISFEANENVNYNEKFPLYRAAGKSLSETLVAAKIRGLPFVVIYVAEYFAANFGSLRWGVDIEHAGRFVYITLWSALVTWCLSNLALIFVVSRGAIGLGVTGLLMMTCCLTYHELQPSIDLVIFFSDAQMHFSYGWCFWSNLLSGGLTFVSSCAVVALDVYHPKVTSKVLLLENADDDDDDAPLNSGVCRTSPVLPSLQLSEVRRTPSQSHFPAAYPSTAATPPGEVFDLEYSTYEHFPLGALATANVLVTPNEKGARVQRL